MRLIGWSLLMVLGLGGPAGEVPPAEAPTADLMAGDAEASALGLPTAWRRTRDGWERPSQWTCPRERRPPGLHPVVVGLLEIFLSAAALVAFSGPAGRRSPAGSECCPRSKLRP